MINGMSIRYATRLLVLQLVLQKLSLSSMRLSHMNFSHQIWGMKWKSFFYFDNDTPFFFSVENILYLFCREQFDTWQLLLRARNEGRLFSKIFWPNDPEMVLFLKKTKNLLAVMLLLVWCFCLSLQKEQIKRLHLLLTVKDSAANIPKNLEARRRLQFFTNSLFMDMPAAKPVSEMIPFRYY
jgi:hypothetical protein